ncbi:MAG: ABC transporter permease subunit [Chloroflexia bacterium]
MLNVMTQDWFWGAVALLMGQLFLTRRVAAGVAGAAMVAAYSFDVNLQSTPSYKALSQLSPYHYYSVNKPLVPGRGFDWGSWLVLIVLGLLFFAASALLYRQRDIGATAFGSSLRRGHAPKPRTGGSLAGLGGLFARSMRDLLGPAIAWTAGLVAYILLIEYSLPALIAPLKSLTSGAFGAILGSVVSTMGFLQVLMLAVVSLVVAGFGLFQVAAWTGDEEAGRLELVLSTPHGRGAVLLARFAALVLITALMVLVMGVTILLVAPAAGITVEADKVWTGMAGLVPFALATAAAGWAIGAFLKRPGPASLIVGVVLVAMYFLDALRPLFKLPDAVLEISIFHAYGRPFLDGLNTGSLLAFSAATLLLLAAALWGFQRRDVVK